MERLLDSKDIVPNREVILYGDHADDASGFKSRLAELGFAGVRIYEGGWAAWSADETLPVDKLPPGRLEELYLRHAPAGLRFAYYLSGDPERARDLVQDAFVRVVGRYAHLRQPDLFETYLRRTIFNLHTSRLRRLRVEREYLAREAGRAALAHHDPDPVERDQMWSAIRALPERQRAAIVLRYYEDLSERESAEILGCSVGALNQLVVRATATLRATIGDDAR